MYLEDSAVDLERVPGLSIDLLEPPPGIGIELDDADEIERVMSAGLEEDSWVLEDFEDLLPENY